MMRTSLEIIIIKEHSSLFYLFSNGDIYQKETIEMADWKVLFYNDFSYDFSFTSEGK